MIRAGLRATEALQEASRATVVSIHRRAVNLLTDRGSLVALVSDELPLHPWAVQLSRPDWSCCGSRLRSGNEVLISHETLRSADWRLLLAGSQVVDLSIRNRPDRVASEIADRLWQNAAARYTDGPFDSVLQAALRDWVAGGKEIALVALVGVGVGLTPSGDDIIAGVLAGLDFCSNAMVGCEASRASLVAALPMPLEDHTTQLSAQMMTAAGNCQYVETLPKLASALAVPKPDWLRVEAAAENLLRLGHRSGRDLLAGFAATLARQG